MCLFPKPTCIALFHNIYCRLVNLKVLQHLDLSKSLFEEVPAVVYKLTSLKSLRLPCSDKLLRIDEQVLQLTHLEILYCTRCESLQHPPYDVCRKGLAEVKKYFIKLRGMSQSCLLYVTELSTLCHRVVYSHCIVWNSKYFYSFRKCPYFYLGFSKDLCVYETCLYPVLSTKPAYIQYCL